MKTKIISFFTISILLVSMSDVFAIGKKYKGYNRRDKNRHGHIGIGLGPSIPVGDLAQDVNVGMNLNAVNFGYKFGESSFGIASSWFGTANFFIEDDNTTWGLGGLMLGPLYSLQLNDKFDLDLKGHFGFSTSLTTSISDDMSTIVQKYDGSGALFGAGSAIRYNFAKSWCFSLNADYISSQLKKEEVNEIQKRGMINISFGLAYRLK